MFRIALIACLVSFGSLACGGGEETPPPAPPAKPAPAAKPALSAADEAAKLFATRCYTCHGKQGAGDGPGSVALTPKPRNLQDPAWQASVTDDHLEKIILYGGAAVGKSPAMPPNPDLNGKPEVVAALVAHVRGLEQE